MRKCPACGYLLFGEGEACKHCGAELPAVADAAVTLAAPAPPSAPPAAPSPFAASPAAPPAAPAAPSYAPPASPFAISAAAPPPSPAYAPPPSPFAAAAPPPPAPSYAAAPSVPTYAPPAPSPFAATPPLASAPAPGPYGATAPPPPDFGRAPVQREYWTPTTTRVAVRQKRSAPRVALALISLVSMALGAFAVDHVLNNDPLPAGTSAFVAGQGFKYSSPDHTFDARFPSAPSVSRQTIPVATSSATISLAQVQTDDYEVVAGSMVLPIPIPAADVGNALQKILEQAVAAQDAKVTGEHQITRYGVPGVEMTATVHDGYPARFMMLVSGTHVYLAGAHAKHATKRLYDALLSSLVLY